MEFLSREGLQYFWQQILGKLNGYVAKGELNSYATKSELDSYAEKDDLNNYVTKENGKGLSSEDYTTEEKTKLASLSTTAEANQNAFGIVNTKSGSVNTTLNAAEEVSALNFEAGANITLAVNAATNTIKIIGAEAPEAPEASLENLGISATATEINHIAGATSNIQTQLNNRFDIVGGGTSIAANTDLNTLTTPGNYSCIAGNVSSLTNCPITEGGFKLVVINGYTTEYKHQFIYWGANSYIYYRTRNSNGTWKNWVLLNNVSLANADGTLPISKGGTGATDINSARISLKTACSYNISEKPTGYDDVWYGWALTNYYASPTSANTWGDAYYMLVSSDGTLRVGTQLNDATSITWSKVYSENYKPTPAAIGAAPASHTHDYVPTSRTVNGKALSSNIILSASDVSAVPTSRTINGKALSSNITLSASDVSAAPASHTHSTLSGWADTRDAKTTPNDYNGFFRVVGIKTPTASGITSDNGGSYSTLVGIRGWSDDSGGNAHELAFCGNGTLYHRHGATTSWGSWAKIYTSANKPTLSELGAAATSHSHGQLIGDYVTTVPLSTDNGALKYVYSVPSTASGIMSTSNNANGILTINTHSGNYYHQIGFSPNGMFYRSVNGTALTNSLAWEKIYTSANKPTLSELGAAPATHTHPEYYNINSVGAAIAENADLNTYTTPGVYYALAATAAKLTNSPTTSGFRLIVERGYSTGCYIQRAMGGSTSNAEWVRYYSGSAWGTWQRTVRADSASSAYPTYLQTYSSYAATLGFGCSDSGMWMRAFRDGAYGEYLYMTKDGKNVYTYARGATDTKVSTLYGTANIHYGSSTPTGAYTGQLWFKPV